MSLGIDDITAVILAGGQGRRLDGSDKGLVLLKQKPIIEHILEKLSKQVSKLMINANRNLDIYQSYNFQVVIDVLSDYQGPLAGFSVAMENASTTHIVTLPCDAPFVEADYIQRLINAAKDDLSIVVAHDGDRIQPVHALIPVKYLDSLGEFLASGERKIDIWYAKHGFVTADFSDSVLMFKNINTKEQLQELEALDD